MNWEAIFAIGVFTVILGMVLLVPGIIWARIRAKQHPDVAAGMSVTKTGYIYIGAMLLVLFAGFTSQYWAPESSLGQWTATRSGRFVFGGAVVAVALLIEKVLRGVGVELKVLKK